MRHGNGGPSRRRKRFLHVAPLPRSRSLNAIPDQPLRCEQRTSGGGGGGSGANNLLGSQHLPPLGGKDRRSSDKQRRKQFSNDENSSRHALGRSSSWGPALHPGEWSSGGPAVVPAPGWTAFADVFVQAGQAAGIAFQWTETETETTLSAGGAPGKLAGLSVVGVADGSLAARHGGISPGMMLVEINRERVAGMGQEKMMRLMRQVASQPRVLTLARIARHPLPLPPPSPPVDESSPGSAEARPEVMETNPEDDKPNPSSAASSAVVNASRQKLSSTASTVGRPSLDNSRPHALASSTSDANGKTPLSVVRNGSKLLTPLLSSYSNKTVSAGSSVPPESSENCFRHPRVPTSSSPQQLIRLRFVGSRGNTSLFDRDHVLGLKSRDIEFVPTNTQAGGKSSPSSRLAEEHRRANSKRSLQDLTRDWRNDPFSTPARRRRLINDVCKVIVRSYTHASVSRVTELRREEFFIVCIQAGFRMRQARRLFCAKLANRRIKAASVLQLGWLSYAARRRVGVLREERDHDRRVEADKRARREARERKERRILKEKERERDEREKRNRQHLCMVVCLQKRFRAQREARRRLVQDAEHLLAEQQRQEATSLRAAISIQAAFRRLQHKRRWLQEEHAEQERMRAKVDAEGTASIRLQSFWRRCGAIKVLNKRRREDTEASTLALLSDETTARRPYRSLADFDGGIPHPPSGAFSRPKKGNRKLLGRGGSGGTQGEASSWENWSSAFEVNPSLAAEIAREGAEENTMSDDNTRPWTAAGAIEQSTAVAPVGRRFGPRPPPAGMMTVTVRRGSDETNVVTPIVLTENGGEEEVSAADASSAFLVPLSAAAAPAGLSSGIDESKSVGRRAQAGRGAQNVMDNAKVGGAIPAACTDVDPEETMSLTRRHDISPVAAREAMASKILTPSCLQEPIASRTSVASNSLPLARATTIVLATDGTAVPPPTEGAAGTATTATVARAAASDGGPQLAANTPTKKAVAKRAEVKPVEQLFMEDTQVYLGCAVCGVKYLVEAVDPGIAKTVQAGQPAPEVLYLCTTCGGTLRNNGEDGRWRRRRRPSSAPAAGRRRGSAPFFNGDSSDSGARKGNIIGGADSERCDGGKPAAAAQGLFNAGGIPKQLLHLGGGGRPGGGNYSATRLRYAHCARIIQHAFQDFRHRQYLRDWAFSLLRRWLTCRVQSRKRDTYRLHRRHAVVIVQSAARAVFARARCAALRAARLRLWMGTFAALYGGDGDIHSASPMATELLQGMNTNPPPPSPPQTPALSQPPALSPQCSAYFATRGGVSGRKKRVGRGRALAEALAPGMGRPPPGCPAAMDVDWGEWGVGFSLVFPPSPGVG